MFSFTVKNILRSYILETYKVFVPIQDSSAGEAWMWDSGVRKLGMRTAGKPMTQPWLMMFNDTLAVRKPWKPMIYSYRDSKIMKSSIIFLLNNQITLKWNRITHNVIPTRDRLLQYSWNSLLSELRSHRQTDKHVPLTRGVVERCFFPIIFSSYVIPIVCNYNYLIITPLCHLSW